MSPTTDSKAASISRSVLALQDMKLQTKGARRLLHVSQLARSRSQCSDSAERRMLPPAAPVHATGRAAWVPVCWSKLLTPVMFPPGRLKLATRPRRDGIAAECGDDRNRRRRGLGRQRRRFAAGRSKHGHRPAREFRRQRRQSVVLALRPAVFDRHVPAFDVSVFGQSPTERGHHMRALVGRRCAEIPDHRHRRLLRARRERPRRRRTAQNTEKFPPPHARPQAQETASYRLKRVL